MEKEIIHLSGQPTEILICWASQKSQPLFTPLQLLSKQINHRSPQSVIKWYLSARWCVWSSASLCSECCWGFV